MEIVFLFMLVGVMAIALGSGFPVAFALPGSAIITIGAAAFFGVLLAGDSGAFFAQGDPLQWLSAGVTNFRGIYWEAERDTLIAIPLFVFMGIMLQRSKIAEDLLVTMAQLFGPMPGGLGISVVFVGALLAATTGIVGATVVAMGLISLPAMMRNNYSNALATGTIAASGTLGQIIPPSIVLIILADQLASATDQASSARKALYRESTGELAMPSEFDVVSTSAGDLFMGAFIPGLVLVALYMLFILGFALLRPKLAPAVHGGDKFGKDFFFHVLLVLVPPLALIFMVLGSIIAGIATVNQAGAIGAAGATLMAGYRLMEGKPRAYWPAILALISVLVLAVIAVATPVNVRSINTPQDAMALNVAIVATVALLIAVGWSIFRTLRLADTLRGVMIETAKTTALVFIILLGAAMLTAAFRAFGGEELVREFLTSLGGGFWMQFFVVMLVIFLMGFFLDFIEIAVVVVPIVAPILLSDPSANVTAVWLGVMIGLNIQTSFLTPPFGFALFYLRGVAPAAVRTMQIYKGVIAFILLQLLALVVVAQYPKLVNYLPTRVSLTSDTAPPPLNPRLQYCLEDYLFDQYEAQEDELRAAIEAVRQLELGYLPEEYQEALTEGLDKAENTFDLVATIRATEADMDAAAVDYRPIHSEVRNLQSQARFARGRIEAAEGHLQRLERSENPSESAMQEYRDYIAEREAEIAALEAQIPETWAAVDADFKTLQRANQQAGQAYRRNVDDAYEPIQELTAVVAATDALAEMQAPLREMRQRVTTAELNEELVDALAELRSNVRDVEGAGDIASLISDARSAVRSSDPNREEALEMLDEAMLALEANLEWRQRASSELLPGLQAYEEAIRHNIGLRQQPRVPREIALEIVGCTAEHRDIALWF